MLASMTELPFREGTFDAAIAYGVFLYADHEGLTKSVGELRRVLKPGGRALVMLRTSDDYRLDHGRKLSPGGHTVVLDDFADSNEQGSVMTFLDEREVRALFSGFTELA